MKEISTAELSVLFRNFDADDSGSVTYQEFVEAILTTDSLKKNAFTGASLMTNVRMDLRRCAFDVTPHSGDLGEICSDRTYECIFRIRNTGDKEVRFKAWVSKNAQKERSHAQTVAVVSSPRGLLAAGISAKIIVVVRALGQSRVDEILYINGGEKITEIPICAEVKPFHQHTPKRSVAVFYRCVVHCHLFRDCEYHPQDRHVREANKQLP